MDSVFWKKIRCPVCRTEVEVKAWAEDTERTLPRHLPDSEGCSVQEVCFASAWTVAEAESMALMRRDGLARRAHP